MLNLFLKVYIDRVSFGRGECKSN